MTPHEHAKTLRRMSADMGPPRHGWPCGQDMDELTEPCATCGPLPGPDVFATAADLIEQQAQTIERLRAAAQLAELYFSRNHISGNWQGDDEHEAWRVLKAALAVVPAEQTND